MNGVGSRAATLRLVAVLIALVLAGAVLTAAFAAGGRPLGQAIAAGSGLIGVLLVLLGTVLLGLARRADGRVTQGTGIGALALGVPFLVVALVV